MCILSYALLLIFSLFSQGSLLSVSKSMRKAEDNMLLSTFSLGKITQNGDKAGKSPPASSFEHYKIEDSSVLDEDRSPHFSNIGYKHHVKNYGPPQSLSVKRLPYFELEGPMTFPSNAEVENIESIQERSETGSDENSANLPIGRRDFDMLRCMLGRVYRPCWQA
ncbi:pro-MCH [Python bivittatus]|uniref:Pro-MCH n=1 Tax=Python bivittatus TaxID=176946 RepID=A0A9F2QVP0_PYTBI|nr:pro-MCH [Python bivittatus]